MAKNSKVVLTKKDFSILETMSRRVDELTVSIKLQKKINFLFFAEIKN
jgi:hypothetical protein